MNPTHGRYKSAQQVRTCHRKVEDGVVLRGPDIQKQHQHRQHHKALRQHHIDNIRLLIDQRPQGTGKDHQTITDKVPRRGLN